MNVKNQVKIKQINIATEYNNLRGKISVVLSLPPASCKPQQGTRPHTCPQT